ncbi:hypothetical protein DICVIV_09594 [Dictyocaulus viviparus]|uniref:Uncharacterized protein n=1 Tax=Dictyocaulus viviparus TaxID=29172 RepID=A0A0D8XIG2_DICVI|nr:hypothetical protein DICVIV_09594 [Dictyocaulus viviparus]
MSVVYKETMIYSKKKSFLRKGGNIPMIFKGLSIPVVTIQGYSKSFLALVYQLRTPLSIMTPLALARVRLYLLGLFEEKRLVAVDDYGNRMPTPDMKQRSKAKCRQFQNDVKIISRTQ